MAIFAFVLVLVIISLFIGASILLLITRLFKIQNPNYKNSVKIFGLSTIASLIIGVILGMLNLGAVSSILATIISFFIFHLLLKKYYQNSWQKSLGVYIVFGIVGFLVSLIIIIPVRIFVFSPFVMTGDSMSPAYNNNDFLLINQFSNDFTRGDVVVYSGDELIHPPPLFIKRVVGLPGEKVEIKDRKVFIDGRVLEEPFALGETFGDISVTLTADQYYVLGDNRAVSVDSRLQGPISKKDIDGKVFYKVAGLFK